MYVLAIQWYDFHELFELLYFICFLISFHVCFSYPNVIALLAHRITGSGESTTHQSCPPRPSTTEAVQPQTLWLKVEEEGEQSIHTQYKHQRWLEPCQEDGKLNSLY